MIEITATVLNRPLVKLGKSTPRLTDKTVRVNRIACISKGVYMAHMVDMSIDAPWHDSTAVRFFKSKNKHVKLPVLGAGESADV